MPFSQSIGSTAATYSVSRDLFSLEQVRLSLGHYSHSRQTWEVVVFFTTDVSNDVSGKRLPFIFSGACLDNLGDLAFYSC